MSPLNPVDLFFLVVVLLGTIRGLVRGLSRELADVLRIGGSFVAIWFLYEPLGQWIFGHTEMTARTSYLLAALAIMLVAFLLLSILHLIVSSIMKLTFPSGVEKVGGLIAGTLKSLIIAVLLVFLVGLMPHEVIRRAVHDESYTGGWVHSRWPELLERLEERYPDAASLRILIEGDKPEEEDSTEQDNGDGQNPDWN